MQENGPPDSGFDDIERQSWRAAIVLIDPRHHADGQKVSMEINATIGRPIALFRSLADAINQRADEPYFMEVSGITDPQTFWEFEEQHRGEITALSFEFVAPNMFGIHDDYEKEMSDLRDVEKIRTAKLQLESPDGLNLKTPRVKSAVNYASRGGGAIRARTKSRKVYSSKNKTKTIAVDMKKVDRKSIFQLLKATLAGMFGL